MVGGRRMRNEWVNFISPSRVLLSFNWMVYTLPANSLNSGDRRRAVQEMRIKLDINFLPFPGDRFSMVWAGLISSKSLVPPTGLPWLAWLKRTWPFDFLWHINWVSVGRGERSNSVCSVYEEKPIRDPIHWTCVNSHRKPQGRPATTGGVGHQNMRQRKSERERVGNRKDAIKIPIQM